MAKDKTLDGLQQKVEGGVTLYDVGRPGGMPVWVDEAKAREALKERESASAPNEPEV